MTDSDSIEMYERVKNSQYCIPLALLALAVIFFPLKGVDPSPDSCWYLSNAVRMYNGLGSETLLIRRPVFPLMISVCFRIFGPSVQSAFYVVRLFFLLNMLMSYYIGAHLFNKATGLTFALLIFTSFVINRWSSYLLLDNIVPFFLLLYILLTYLAMERSAIMYFVLAGLSLGVGFLLKGITVLMYLPLPVCLLAVKKYRNSKNIICLSLIFISAVVVLSPWLYRIAAGDETLEIIVGPLADFDMMNDYGLVPSTQTGKALSEILLEEAKGLFSFLNNYIYRKFKLSIFFFLGGIYTVYRAFFEKQIPEQVVLICVVLFSPIVYAIAKTNFRTGQLLLLYCLLYLMTANLLINFPNELFSRIPDGRINPSTKRRLLRTIQFAVVALSVITQAFLGVNSKKNLYALITNNRISNIYEFSFWRGDFTHTRWADETVRQASKWVEENIPCGTDILCQWSNRTAIDFFTGAKYSLSELGNFSIRELIKEDMPSKAKRNRICKAINKSSVDTFGKPLFIWTRWRDEKFLHCIFEEHLLKQINDNRVGYIIVTLRRNFLSLYFQDNPDVSLVKSFSGGRIKIYKVNKYPVAPSEGFAVRFGEGIYKVSVYKYFRQLYEKDLSEYRRQKRNIKTILRWPDDRAEEFFLFFEEARQKEFYDHYRHILVKEDTVY